MPATDDGARNEAAARAMSEKRLFTMLLIGLGIVIIAWLYAQPYFVLGEIRHAAEAGDRGALTELVDFPRLRESLKVSLNVDLAKSAGEGSEDIPFAGPSPPPAVAVDERLLAGYLAPTGIALLTEGQRPDSTLTRASVGSSRSARVRQGYVSPSEFVALVESGSAGRTWIAFVLRRRGLSWVLTDVELPLANAEPTRAAPVPRRQPIREPHPVGARVDERLDQHTNLESRGHSDGESDGSRDSIATASHTAVLPGPNDYVYIDELPEALTKVRPDYPEAARRSGAQGVVIIKALIGVDGLVKDAMIVKSVPLLDEAAMASVRRWTFRPALRGGVPVAVWVAVPVKFTVF